MNKYEYELLNYWEDLGVIYVNYIIQDIESLKKANVIDYYNVSDIPDSSLNTRDTLEKLIKKNNGWEFKLPKVSELSPLLRDVYDQVCESESNMCYIDYNEWKELKEDYEFLDEDIITLKNEIKKYNLDDYITVDDGEYMICVYGGLQCKFNDDRRIGSDELER